MERASVRPSVAVSAAKSWSSCEIGYRNVLQKVVEQARVFVKVRSVCNALLKDLGAVLSVLIMSRPIWVKSGTGGSPRNAVERLFHKNRCRDTCTLLKSVKKFSPHFLHVYGNRSLF